MSFLEDLIKAADEPCPMARKFKVKKCFGDWTQLYGTNYIISKEVLDLSNDRDHVLKHIHNSSISRIGIGIEPEITKTFKENKFNMNYGYSVIIVRKLKRK